MTALLAAAAALAQTPADPWRTVRTEHFRVHYPLAAEVWTLDAVSRLEAWHERVTEEVGYIPERPIRVVVVDPWSEANGAAFPFARSPRIQLYATAPEASSIIGHYRSWAEVLLVHEDAHVVHLVREPRNGLERGLRVITGLGPVTTKSPRWVIEGYATVVEARLTGFGRPNGDLRALVLRRLATEGRLPSYGELSASSRWMGGSFAYLVGSAYLEWLERRAGPGALRALWARMTAKRMRSFEEAFEGVFGEAPDVMYGRFTAEVTAEAVAIERAADAGADELFERIGWSVGPPAVSPDGARVAVPTFPKRGPSRLVVWSTEVDEKAQEKRQEAIDHLLEEDPLDVAPVPPAHPPHERKHTRRSYVTPPRDPRWTPDGEALLFAAGTWDADGRRRYDLWRWEVDGGTERITRGADVRSPDPAPDGTWAVAVRHDWGQTQLVRVDLATGAWTPLSEPEAGAVADAPRISPDAKHLAWLENRGSGFGVVVQDLAAGTRWTSSPGAGGAEAVHLAWSRDGRALYASMGDRGFVEVHEVWRDGGAGAGRLTSTPGGAMFVDPAPGEDRLAYYLAMGARGLDLHRAPLAVSGLGESTDAGAEPVRRPAPPPAPDLPVPVELEPRRYGAGPLDVGPLFGGGLTTAGRHGQGELGLRFGDPVGRWELVAIGAVTAADAGATGGRLGLAFRGLPADVAIDGWGAADSAFVTQRAGASLRVEREVLGPSWRVDGAIDGLFDTSIGLDRNGDRVAGGVELGAGWSEPSNAWIGLSAVGRLMGGSTHGAGWSGAEAAGAVRLLDSWPVHLGYGYGTSSGPPSALDRYVLGGVATSILPDAAQAWRVTDPAFAPGVATGARHDRVEVAVGQGIAPYAVRHRFGEDRLGGEALSAIGIRSELSFEAQPIVRVPAGRVEAGVACRVEWPGTGWEARPCQAWRDYAAWASITWAR